MSNTMREYEVESMRILAKVKAFIIFSESLKKSYSKVDPNHKNTCEALKISGMSMIPSFIRYYFVDSQH